MQSGSNASVARVVFLTRDPVIHQQGGSTTYALGLLELLRAQGAQVTLVGTLARGRSPRLIFRVREQPPSGVVLRFPGYWRLGSYFLKPLGLKVWARIGSRLASRDDFWLPLCRLLEWIFGDRLFTGAWDLTAPTDAERELAVQEILAFGATAVVANYCIWGPVLADERLRSRRTAILMHDLLSDRTAKLLNSGLALDSPAFEAEQEMCWLSAAQTVLAAQEREAEEIRPRVRAKVIVTPVMLHPRALGEEQVEAGRCLFVGSNIVPNRTGLDFLLQQVWPRVREAVPGATLAVAGTVSSAPEAQGKIPGVVRLGRVPLLETEYARAEVCLVPLLLGTGIKIKLLEALEFGKAIVSTPVGVQGIEEWAHEAIEVAEEPEAFADAIIRLLRDAALRRSRQSKALRLAEIHFGPGRELPEQFRDALFSSSS